MSEHTPTINQKFEDLKSDLGRIRTDLEKIQTEYRNDRKWLFRFFFFFIGGVAVFYSVTMQQIGSKISDELGKTALKQLADSAKSMVNSIALQKIRSDSLLKSAEEQGKLMIFQGSTPETNTPWEDFQNGVMVYVNTESYHFKSTPTYLTALGGNAGIWTSMGATSIYDPTPNGFKVYVRPYDPKNRDAKITANEARGAKWHIEWVAFLLK